MPTNPTTSTTSKAVHVGDLIVYQVGPDDLMPGEMDQPSPVAAAGYHVGDALPGELAAHHGSTGARLRVFLGRGDVAWLVNVHEGTEPGQWTPWHR